MGRSWTKEQGLAISTRDRTLLVSAAAGSGKTATLTERIIRSILDKENPLNISNMLIVTFTNAAVGELRERITEALKTAIRENPEDDRLREQLLMLPGAKISTIDSFCSDILRANCDRVGVSPNYRIADTAEGALLADRIMNALIGSVYRGEDSDILPAELERLADCLTDSKKQDELAGALGEIYEKTLSSELGVDTIGALIEEYNPERYTSVDNTKYVRYLRDRTQGMCEHYEKVFSGVIGEISAHPEWKGAKAMTVLDSDLALVESLHRASTYCEARKFILEYAFPRTVSIKDEAAPKVKPIRDAFREDIQYFKDTFYRFDEQMWQKSYALLYKTLTVLYKFLKKFDKLFREDKIRRGICQYSDIERYTYECLWQGGVRTDIANAQAKQYSAIYIDEYQDVNSLQNKIFEAVATDKNRFMVGDIKQSIYGFRSANPKIFADMKMTLPSLNSEIEQSAASIFMSRNFRCDEGIVDYTNHIFDKVFGLISRSIGYESDDRLIHGKMYEGEKPRYIYPSTCVVDKRIEAELRAKSQELDNPEEIHLQPRVVARKIYELLNGGATLNSGCAITPGDIAIILRNTKGHDKLYARELQRLGIPSAIDDAKSFFLNADVLLCLSLLSVIDNPKKDIQLASVMCSPLFSFSADELVYIRAQGCETLYDCLVKHVENNPDYERGVNFLKCLDEYRFLSEGTNVDKLIMTLYRKTGLLSLASGNDGKKNLMLLYEYARKFEAGSFKGLYNFISYINSIVDKKHDFDKNQTPEDADAVKIITVHSSKGLEYPIVFFAEADISVQKTQDKARLVYDENFGIGLDLRTDSSLAIVENPTRPIIKDYILRRSFEEEMRVLYVALTRARERLYVVGRPSRFAENFYEQVELSREYLSEFALYNMPSYLDCICATVRSGVCDIEGFLSDASSVKLVQNEAESTEVIEKLQAQIDLSALDVLKSRFSFKYPGEVTASLPEKLSVSHLNPRILDGTGEEITELFESEEQVCECENDERKNNDNALGLDLRFGTSGVLPRFISGVDERESAKRGISTHLVLQFCDFELLYKNGSRAEVERLFAKKFISEDDVKRIRLFELEKFRTSKLFALMREAKSLEREFRFNVLLPADNFTEREENKRQLAHENILVQGVIDCLIEGEDGEYILVDYKTDRLTKEEREDISLAEKRLRLAHAEQLKYYACAVEKIFGKKPKKTLIYSLHLGDTVDIHVKT